MPETTHVLPGDILAEFLGQLEAGDALTFEGLTLHPLIPTRRGGDGLMLETLDEALGSGHLLVTEIDEAGSVNTIVVENRSDFPIFIMAGEILRGSKQDRTMQEDLVIPPRSGRMEVSCFCTERGRWRRVSRHFESSGEALPTRARAVSKVSRSQGEVWHSIATFQASTSAFSPTESAREVYEIPHVRQSLEAFQEALGDLPARAPEAVGVVAMSGESVLAVDVFGTGEVFRKLYPKLLKAYAADVLGAGRRGDRLRRDMPLKLLRRATEAKWKDRPSTGLGTALEIAPSDLGGTALVLEGQVVHSDLFPLERI